MNNCCYNEETEEYYEMISISPSKEMCGCCQTKFEMEFEDES